MDIQAVALDKELRELRQRAGVYRLDMSEHFGPQLRAVCGVTDLATAAELRSGLERCVEDLLAGDADAILVVKAALGFYPAGNSGEFDTFEKRLQWLLHTLRTNEKSARGRVDGVFRLLARRAEARTERLKAVERDPGYVLDRFDVELRFYGYQPTIVERRMLRSAKAGLSTIRIRRGLPEAPDSIGLACPVKINVLTKGAHVADVEYRPKYAAFCIEFDKPLAKAEPRELVVELTLASELPPLLHYVAQPATPVGVFSPTCLFDPGQLPARVRRVNGLPHGEIDIFRETDELLTPDASGKIETSFHQLRDGRSYGIAWKWD